MTTVAPLSQQLTHVSTGSMECPLLSHVGSKNGVEIERTWTATVLNLVICIDREQTPYVQYSFLLLLLFFIRTSQNSDSTGRYEMIVTHEEMILDN